MCVQTSELLRAYLTFPKKVDRYLMLYLVKGINTRQQNIQTIHFALC